MKKVMILVAASVLTAASVAVAFVAQGGQAGDTASQKPRNTFTLAAAQAMTDYPVYNAGASVEGLPLVAVLRRDDSAAKYVSFIYGSCYPTGDMGCAPPAEVQTWPACVRNPSLYKRNRPPSPVPEPTSVRDVPAAFFDDGERLEIQAGAATIVIFAASRDVVRRIADELRGVNNSVEAGAPLPHPTPGSVEGTLTCR